MSVYEWAPEHSLSPRGVVYRGGIKIAAGITLREARSAFPEVWDMRDPGVIRECIDYFAEQYADAMKAGELESATVYGNAWYEAFTSQLERV